MKRRVFIGLLAGALAGCVSYHTPPADRRVTVAPDLGTAVWVTDVRLVVAPQRHAQLQANVANNTDHVVRLEYRAEWLDANGVAFDSVTSTWLPISAAPRDVVPLRLTAPDARAVDFRLYVQAERR